MESTIAALATETCSAVEEAADHDSTGSEDCRAVEELSKRCAPGSAERSSLSSSESLSAAAWWLDSVEDEINELEEVDDDEDAVGCGGGGGVWAGGGGRRDEDPDEIEEMEEAAAAAADGDEERFDEGEGWDEKSYVCGDRKAAAAWDWRTSGGCC